MNLVRVFHNMNDVNSDLKCHIWSTSTSHILTSKKIFQYPIILDAVNASICPPPSPSSLISQPTTYTYILNLSKRTSPFRRCHLFVHHQSDNLVNKCARSYYGQRMNSFRCRIKVLPCDYSTQMGKSGRNLFWNSRNRFGPMKSK